MMRGKTPELQCYLLDTGYCLAWEHHLIAGGQRRRVACHSLAALLHHPDHGWLLWDTGYAPRMLAATQDLPFSLYRRATPLHLDERLSVAAQLERWQLRPQDIKRVLISHFHADHIAGLRDFPEAEFIATQSAYADVADRRGLAALRRAFIPALLPSDFAARATLLNEFAGPELPALGSCHDLFQDGSVLLFGLPGHARGQMGLLVQTQRGRILFAADGAWLKRSIDEQRPPSRLTSLFIDDGRAVRTTLQRLHAFQQQQPDIVIIPSHCPATFAREVEGVDETV